MSDLEQLIKAYANLTPEEQQQFRKQALMPKEAKLNDLKFIAESDFSDYLSNLTDYEERLARGEIQW